MSVNGGLGIYRPPAGEHCCLLGLCFRDGFGLRNVVVPAGSLPFDANAEHCLDRWQIAIIVLPRQAANLLAPVRLSGR